jgi:NAD(P)-dependent dehydrogenase (short-subunit alcohol dehydrogenase family)
LADAPASERLAVVTGSSTGIGAAVAKQLLQRGWEVAGIARRNPGIEDARYRHLAADLQDAPAAVASIEHRLSELLSERKWRRIGLVNNAASAAATGPVQRLDAAELVRVYSVNVAMPLWLMGFVARRSPREAAIRIVNLSSGAAVRASPGLAAYCSSKAALRMAGMVFAAELDSPLRSADLPADISIVSYSPGVVDTEMQLASRSLSAEEFPWGGMFKDFAAQGLLAAPELPAAEVVEFLESEASERFAERKRG